MFTSAEVVHSGRQDLVMSRLASAVRAVHDGSLGADAYLLEALHMPLDQGAQQRHCIDLDGSQDPRSWLRWARAGVAEVTGADSVVVEELRRARAAAASRLSASSAAPGGGVDVVLVRDALTGSLDPRSGEAARSLLEQYGWRVGVSELVSCGTVEHFAGLADEAQEAVRDSVARLVGWSNAMFVTDDPAVAFASARLWPSNAAPRVPHLAEFLQSHPGGLAADEHPTRGRVAINDVGLLAGDLGVSDQVRAVLIEAGYTVVEPPSTGANARDDGPMFGYQDADLLAGMGQSRYGELARTGADLIVTVAPWSRRNLSGDQQVPVVSLAEALARSVASWLPEVAEQAAG